MTGFCGVSSWSKTKEKREESDGGFVSEMGLGLELELESELCVEEIGREESHQIMGRLLAVQQRRRDRVAEVAMSENG
jgi:hypothetical protein